MARSVGSVEPTGSPDPSFPVVPPAPLTGASVVARPAGCGGRTRPTRSSALGRQEEADFAIIKISDEGKWPFAEMGSTKELKEGSIVLSTGHPGGFRRERPPVLRLGQVTSLDGRFMETSPIELRVLFSA